MSPSHHLPIFVDASPVKASAALRSVAPPRPLLRRRSRRDGLLLLVVVVLLGGLAAVPQELALHQLGARPQRDHAEERRVLVRPRRARAPAVVPPQLVQRLRPEGPFEALRRFTHYAVLPRLAVLLDQVRQQVRRRVPGPLPVVAAHDPKQLHRPRRPRAVRHEHHTVARARRPHAVGDAVRDDDLPRFDVDLGVVVEAIPTIALAVVVRRDGREADGQVQLLERRERFRDARPERRGAADARVARLLGVAHGGLGRGLAGHALRGRCHAAVFQSMCVLPLCWAASCTQRL